MKLSEFQNYSKKYWKYSDSTKYKFAYEFLGLMFKTGKPVTETTNENFKSEIGDHFSMKLMTGKTNSPNIIKKVTITCESIA